MNLILTSDFPLTPNDLVLDRMRATGQRPSVAWIPPFTKTGHEHFPIAQKLLKSYGFSNLEYCDIDEKQNVEQLARLERYDVIYLSGGDPIAFRHRILRSGLSMRLRQCLAADRLIVAASGGSMQFTANLSLFRLLTETLQDVVCTRADYEGLGVVDYEVLPHLNRFDSSFLETVQQYSKQAGQEVVALADGAAVLHLGRTNYQFIGTTLVISKGIIIS